MGIKAFDPNCFLINGRISPFHYLNTAIVYICVKIEPMTSPKL